MRAVTSDHRQRQPDGQASCRVLDQFAALDSYSSDATGGRRLSRDAPRSAPPARNLSHSLPAPTRSQRAGARMRWTGSLSVLFIGGLGLAVLAGPANCPCTSAFAVAEQSSLARLGYVQNVRMLTEREIEAAAGRRADDAFDHRAPRAGARSRPACRRSPPRRSSRRAMSPPVRATTSPATQRRPPACKDRGGSRRRGPSTVRLAAASNVETDVPPTLPVIEVATPPRQVTPLRTDDESGPVAASRYAKKRCDARLSHADDDCARKSKKSAWRTAQRSPKWAQQMFVTPWQTQAFSYTQ